MRHPISRALTALTLTVLTLLTIPTGSAQAAANPVLTFDNASVAPGETLTITGRGNFAPYTVCLTYNDTLWWCDEPGTFSTPPLTNYSWDKLRTVLALAGYPADIPVTQTWWFYKTTDLSNTDNPYATGATPAYTFSNQVEAAGYAPAIIIDLPSVAPGETISWHPNAYLAGYTACLFANITLITCDKDETTRTVTWKQLKTLLHNHKIDTKGDVPLEWRIYTTSRLGTVTPSDSTIAKHSYSFSFEAGTDESESGSDDLTLLIIVLALMLSGLIVAGIVRMRARQD